MLLAWDCCWARAAAMGLGGCVEGMLAGLMREEEGAKSEGSISEGSLPISLSLSDTSSIRGFIDIVVVVGL